MPNESDNFPFGATHLETDVMISGEAMRSLLFHLMNRRLTYFTCILFRILFSDLISFQFCFLISNFHFFIHINRHMHTLYDLRYLAINRGCFCCYCWYVGARFCVLYVALRSLRTDTSHKYYILVSCLYHDCNALYSL